MAKLRTNENTQYLKKKGFITTHRASKRAKNRSNRLETREAKTVNEDLNIIINYHNLYFKKTKQTKQFNHWLSKQLNIELEKVTFANKVNRYINTLWEAVKGRL